jgi:hypothetical protein
MAFMNRTNSDEEEMPRVAPDDVLDYEQGPWDGPDDVVDDWEWGMGWRHPDFS